MKRSTILLTVLLIALTAFQLQSTFHISKKFRHFCRGVKSIVRKDHEERYLVQSKLSIVDEIKEPKSFVVLIQSSKNSYENIKSIRSACEQIYDDFRIVYLDQHNSIEELKEVAKQCNKESIVQFIDVPSDRPLLSAIYEVLSSCENDDVVVSIERYNSFLHHEALNYLNYCYQNPNVWMTFGGTLVWPDYYSADQGQLSDKDIKRARFRSIRKFEHIPVTFYAGLFKHISLKDFFIRGEFFKDCKNYAFIDPMVEMASSHVFTAIKPTFLQNKAKYDKTAEFTKKSHFVNYEEEFSFLKNEMRKYHQARRALHLDKRDPDSTPKVDLVVNSQDSPMELCAALSSYKKNIKGIHHIFVLYGATNQSFRNAYAECIDEFPEITFLDKRLPRENIVEAIQRASKKEDTASSIAFASDNMICVKPVNLVDVSEEYLLSGSVGLILGHTIPLKGSVKVDKDREVVPISKIFNIQEARYPFFFGITNRDELIKAINRKDIAFSELFSYHLFFSHQQNDVLLFDTVDVSIPLTRNFIREQKDRENSLNNFLAGKRIDINEFCDSSIVTVSDEEKSSSLMLQSTFDSNKKK